MREFAPVAITYLTWIATTVGLVVLGLRRLGRT